MRYSTKYPSTKKLDLHSPRDYLEITAVNSSFLSSELQIFNFPAFKYHYQTTNKSTSV